MSMPSLTYPSTALSRLCDYVELTKPKIATLVLATVAVASFLGSWGSVDWWLLLHTLGGTLLVAASASAFNQWIEQETDRLMPRTCDRPLPAGRLSSRQVVTFGCVSIVLGLAYLLMAVGPLTAALGLLTWILYVVCYTPLKTVSPLNTAVGAVAGALPVLMGWAAVDAPLNARAFCLFLIVFLWQFPHFMAIAWIYRREYAQAGIQMLSVVDPVGYRVGGQAVIGALLLIPISLLPTLYHLADTIYFGWALALGVAQFACAVLFAIRLSEGAARRLLWASLLYLPGLLMMLLLGNH